MEKRKQEKKWLKHWTIGFACLNTILTAKYFDIYGKDNIRVKV